MKNYISFCPAAHQQPTEPSPFPLRGKETQAHLPPSPMQRMGTAEFTALLLLLTQFPIPPHVTPRCPSLYFARCSPASSCEQDQSRAGRNMGQGTRKTVSSLLHLCWLCCRAAGAELARPPWAAFCGRRGPNHLFASAPKRGCEQRHIGTKLQFHPGGGGMEPISDSITPTAPCGLPSEAHSPASSQPSAPAAQN